MATAVPMVRDSELSTRIAAPALGSAVFKHRTRPPFVSHELANSPASKVHKRKSRRWLRPAAGASQSQRSPIVHPPALDATVFKQDALMSIPYCYTRNFGGRAKVNGGDVLGTPTLAHRPALDAP